MLVLYICGITENYAVYHIDDSFDIWLRCDVTPTSCFLQSQIFSCSLLPADVPFQSAVGSALQPNISDQVEVDLCAVCLSATYNHLFSL